MWQPILMINGCLISIMGFMMLVPAAVDLYYKENVGFGFLISSIMLIFIGVLLFLANQTKIKKITLQQGYLLTVTSWFFLTILAALPFVILKFLPNFADAVFEAASGISTTGATVITNLEEAPRAILLWRSLLSALGGVGIVIFAVAVLPFLGIGGMQAFHRENSDINDKILPKFSSIAIDIILIYLFLNLCGVFLLNVSGMNWFDAFNHAFTSVATSGFSTHDASIGFYKSVQIELALIILMILGSLPLTFYILLFQRKSVTILRLEQVKVFIKVLLFYVAITFVWLFLTEKYDIFEALRYASFNVISLTTTTGYTNTDYLLWGPLAGVLFVVFSLTGGCTGSTTGSVKMFRWQVIFAYLKKVLTNLVNPNRVTPLKIGGVNINEEVVSSVFVFILMYVLSLVMLTFLVCASGIDFESAFGAVVACVTSTGPGIGDIVGPSGNYSGFSDFAKYILAFGMLLGRLEIMTVIAIFTRSFWR